MTFGTLAVFIKLGLCPEAFAGSAVFSGVLALIDIALVVESLENGLDGFYVIIVGSSDIAVVAYVHV